MPKTYYRCSKCHKQVFFKYDNRTINTICPYHGIIPKWRDVYRCVDNYWWELLYITIRTIFRDIREVWRVYLEYNRTIKKFRRILKCLK